MKQRLLVELDDPADGFSVGGGHEFGAEAGRFRLQFGDHLRRAYLAVISKPRGLACENELGVDIVERLALRSKLQPRDGLRRLDVAVAIHRRIVVGDVEREAERMRGNAAYFYEHARRQPRETAKRVSHVETPPRQENDGG